MEYRLVIDIEAQKETSNAIDYYDNIDPNIGTRFLKELSETYQKVRSNPQHYSFVSSSRKNKIMDIKMKSFPFVVVFEVRNEVVMIIFSNEYTQTAKTA